MLLLYYIFYIRVSTLEAVAAFFQEYGESQEVVQGLLNNLKNKVNQYKI